MTAFPLPLFELLGKYGEYAVYLAIGFAFGFVLEISGFGKSTKLAAQFYFKDLTVLKVMFTAIVVAMVLISSATALGFLDYNRIWVNPTYLWPGILGGLIMGFGFILGGFCPGTSLVSAATAKLDGLLFALGVFFGIFVFGETVQAFDGFWHSSYFGRLTLMDWLNLNTGVVVLLLVLMALFMFWGSEQLEKIFGGKDPKKAPKLRYAGAGILVAIAVFLVIFGQPTTADKWSRLSLEKQISLDERQVQIHPGELLDSIHNQSLKIIMLDVRTEADFNLFHIQHANHAPLEQISSMVAELLLEPSNTLIVVMSNDEAAATEAWKILTAESVPNVYILEGGINYWLATFQEGASDKTAALNLKASDNLRYDFNIALGARHPAADPDPHEFELEYTPKVKLQVKKALSGGCG
jgi:rhodanese-related sulfurtransferase